METENLFRKKVDLFVKKMFLCKPFYNHLRLNIIETKQLVQVLIGRPDAEGLGTHGTANDGQASNEPR